MTDKQPNALRLAQQLEAGDIHECAAQAADELRLLHVSVEALEQENLRRYERIAALEKALQVNIMEIQNLPALPERAGIGYYALASARSGTKHVYREDDCYTADQMWDYAALAAASEREACAQVAGSRDGEIFPAIEIAAAIRARQILGGSDAQAQ